MTIDRHGKIGLVEYDHSIDEITQVAPAYQAVKYKNKKNKKN
jgi:hypothetical protein